MIEHVQNVIAYFHSLHAALRSGGILIFNDRFYPDPPAVDAVLDENSYHPIRLTVDVFDVFLIRFRYCVRQLRRASSDQWLARAQSERRRISRHCEEERLIVHHECREISASFLGYRDEGA